jgi:hypothetical protein
MKSMDMLNVEEWKVERSTGEVDSIIAHVCEPTAAGGLWFYDYMNYDGTRRRTVALYAVHQWHIVTRVEPDAD